MTRQEVNDLIAAAIRAERSRMAAIIDLAVSDIHSMDPQGAVKALDTIADLIRDENVDQDGIARDPGSGPMP